MAVDTDSRPDLDADQPETQVNTETVGEAPAATSQTQTQPITGAKISGGKMSKRTKQILAGVGGLGLLGTIAAIFFFLLLFKNVHIENVFINYEFAKFNRAYQERMNEAVKEAQGEAKGNADTTVDAAASPEAQIQAMNETQIETLNQNPDALAQATTEAEKLDQAPSGPGTGADVATEMGINDGIAGVSGESDDKATADTTKAVEADAAGNEATVGAPVDAVDNATSDAQTAIDNGAAAGSTELENAAAQGFSRGFNGVAAKISGAGILVTLGCIARDIYVKAWHTFAQSIFNGDGRVAASQSKYADCQKQGKCSLTQVGAVANLCDDGKTSCTDSADYQRATGSPVTGPELPAAYQPTAAPQSDNTQVANLISFGGKIDSAFNLVGIGKGCSFILSKPGQAAIIGLGVVTTVAGFVSDAADFGLSTVAQAAATGAAAVVATTAGKALAVKAALYYGGILFKAPITGALRGSVLGAGNKAIATDSCRRDGCAPLTQDQNNQISLAIEQDQIKTAQQKGLAYRLFSPHYSHSALGAIADRTPANPASALADMHQLAASMLSPSKLITGFMQLLSSGSTAHADAAAFGSDGIPDYGLTDAQLHQWGVVQNSQWVASNMNQSNFDHYDPCFTAPMMDILTNKDSNGDHDYNYCNATEQQDPMLAHYRIYKLDQRVTHDIVLLYNNQIEPGGPTTTSNNVVPPGQSVNGCVNPFTDPRWGLSRTDQGVDYSSTVPLPVYAICGGIIQGVHAHGWPQGNFIYYKINDGPPELVGKCIYVAENLSNLPTVGEKVVAGQQIATTVPGSPNTEWGWAAGAGAPSTRYNGDKDGTAEPGGKAFARFIKSLGGPVRDDPGLGPIYTGNICP